MGWNAELKIREEVIHKWGYTHNCNKMIATVLEEHGAKLKTHWLIGHMGKSWFDILDNKNGLKGALLLNLIVNGLESEPLKFQAMNPINGWGSYTTLLSMLKEMAQHSSDYPQARWSISG